MKHKKQTRKQLWQVIKKISFCLLCEEREDHVFGALIDPCPQELAHGRWYLVVDLREDAHNASLQNSNRYISIYKQTKTNLTLVLRKSSKTSDATALAKI